MVEVGYLHIDNPIAVISSQNRLESDNSAGLILLDGFDLDVVSPSQIQSRLNDAKKKLQEWKQERSNFPDIHDGQGTKGKQPGERKHSHFVALGLCATCSEDGPLLETARIAAQNLCLLELKMSSIRDPIRLLELILLLKRSGVTLSLRIRPEDLSNTLLEKLNESDLDIIHLDLRGLNGVSPKLVKKAADVRGPAIIALADVEDFEDARNLLAMGADVVSLRGADADFVQWLAEAMAEYDNLSGWCNAPKHICAGGDLRGLTFCCPPVKNCAVFGALKRAGLTPEEFVNRKLAAAKGTPLEKGEGTCFGSLVWCCKISKPCYLRDEALVRANLSEKEYMELKKMLAEKILPKMH